MRSRFTLVTMVTVAALAAPVVPAHAGNDLVDRHNRVMYEVQRDPATGKTVTRVRETVVDPSGKMLSTADSVVTSAPRPLGQGKFSCIYDSTRPGFRSHTVVNQFHERKNEFVHFQYFPYSQKPARTVGRELTQQWLICATGGAEANNGSRLTMSGPVIAYGNRDTPYKIGQVWRTGRTPPNHTVTLGFQAGKDPVHVTGSITQNAVEFLKGSPRAPFDRKNNALAANQVAGWWEHSCLPLCRRYNGSTDWQGSVVEGLWEFPNSATVRQEDFYYAFSLQHHCSWPRGC